MMLFPCSFLGISPAAALSVSTSWIGNAFGTPNDHIMQTINYMYVRPDGAVAAITDWEEGGHNVTVFKNGAQMCYPVESGTGSWGRMSGRSVTLDSQYVYQAMSQHGNDGGNYPALNANGLYQNPPPGRITWQCVRRYFITNTGQASNGARFDSGYGYDGSFLIIADSGALPTGLCVDNGELFVADPNNGGSIKVYNTASLRRTPVRGWSMTRPGQLAVDSAGYLWMLRVRDSVNAPEIIRFSKTGVMHSQRIDFVDSLVPQCFGVDARRNRILVSNDGPAQNVLIYTNITTTPQLSSTFGATGGINSGTPGQVAPLKFNGPTGVGCDSAGNIYVASNATGVVLESYTSQGQRRWQLQGLEFVDNASLDPASQTDVYTKHEHFKLDYTKSTPGSEWSYVGCTLNRFKYPSDPRWHSSSDAAWVRTMGGRRFLILTDMYTSFLQFFRFSPLTDGETAIPCATISNGTFAPWVTSGYGVTWIDKNGNGDYDNGEFESANDYPYIGGWWVDSIGDAWKVVRRSSPDIGIIKYPFQGLNAYGVPQYTNATRISQAAPSIFTDPHKLEYYPASDRMYLAGFTSDYPAPGDAAGGLGTEVIRYDNWSTGSPSMRWRIRVPLTDTTAAMSASNMPDGAGMSVCGDYLFIVSGRNRLAWVYSVATGTRVGEILPGPEIGSSYGWVDIPYGIRAFKRSSGEYTIFVEDDANAKVIMYRWCPGGNCSEISAVNPPGITPENNRPGLSVRAIDKGISIGFAARGVYAISIFSAAGEEVARHSGSSTGSVSLRAQLPPGVYFVNLAANGNSAVRSMACW
jgi:hypothetical protein